jgi:hypothetical protein
LCYYAKNCKALWCYIKESLVNTACRGYVPTLSAIISDLAVFLRGYNFAAGLMEIVGCIIISQWLTNLNSIAAVTILHIIPMCVQIRIPVTFRRGAVKYVRDSVCGVKFWLIGLELLSPLQFVLQERCACDYCRKNCLELWRMYR